MPKKNLPSYRLHKPTGQAIVVLRGKMFYLGEYKNKESRAKYNALIADHLTNDCKLPPTRTRNEITCEDLAIQFLEWARGSINVKDGVSTSMFSLCNLPLIPSSDITAGTSSPNSGRSLWSFFAINGVFPVMLNQLSNRGLAVPEGRSRLSRLIVHVDAIEVAAVLPGTWSESISSPQKVCTEVLVGGTSIHVMDSVEHVLREVGNVRVGTP